MVSVSVTASHLFTHTLHAGYILNAHIPVVAVSKPNMPFLLILHPSLSLIVSASAILLFQIINGVYVNYWPLYRDCSANGVSE